MRGLHPKLDKDELSRDDLYSLQHRIADYDTDNERCYDIKGMPYKQPPTPLQHYAQSAIMPHDPPLWSNPQRNVTKKDLRSGDENHPASYGGCIAHNSNLKI
ncbi:hypothetical protein AAG570_002673 [Ranatra chinensis]|uniref:Uncharacterized protein n=1 Tax=Ranatra chinensis TaxID=642074 RepID=A0ABD0YKG7_9HEMI